MLGKYSHRDVCAFCESKDLAKFLDLGTMPLAGGFITKEDVPGEKSYPLVVYFCKSCGLVQLLDIVPADVLFKEYFYLSSTTKTLSRHFESLAKTLRERFLDENSFVVEIGSNDGVFLKSMSDLGVKSLGFEPARNISEVARSRGLNVVNDFFTEKSAAEVAGKYGKADLVSASNVFAHIDDIKGVVRGVKAILKEDGVFVFEVHYLLDLVEKMQYDTIYHEHMFYHSLVALTKFFAGMGMEVFDVERIPIHEGSIRVFVKNSGDRRHEASPSVENLLREERKAGIDKFETMLAFGERVADHKRALRETVDQIKAEGKRIVGYGAPGRGNTLLNYCGIDASVLEYTTDESPTRMGRLTPGTHIPIVSPDVFRKDLPEFALMLAWSYMREILEKEKDFIEKGGKFVVPLPTPKIIP